MKLQAKFLLFNVLLILTGFKIYSMNSDHAPNIFHDFETHIKNRQYAFALSDVASLTVYKTMNLEFAGCEYYSLPYQPYDTEVCLILQKAGHSLPQDTKQLGIIYDYARQRLCIQRDQDFERVQIKKDLFYYSNKENYRC